MIRTLPEIEATVLRAGRGSGVPVAQAEDIARAARWLAAAGQMRGLDEVARCLALPRGSARPTRWVASYVFAPGDPALMLPAAIDLALTGADVRLRGMPRALTGALIACAPALEGRAVRAAWSGRDATLSLGPRGREPHLSDRSAQVDLPVWAALTALAAQTYVPASDASRDGAGAGDDS
ncbi:MAG: DUF3726 domain-containing protein [Pseudomonadota bacterium]